MLTETLETTSTVDDLTNAEDTHLVNLAKKGSEEAFGELFRRYQDRILSAVSHIIFNREDAEDVVQDAFIQAWEKIKSFEGRNRASFYTWLYRIAVNMTLSHGRRRKVRFSLENTRDVTGEEPLAPYEAPEERMLRKECVAKLRTALNKLSEEHSTIITLRVARGFSYEQIEQILNLSAGTVRSRLHRARNQLREQLYIASEAVRSSDKPFNRLDALIHEALLMLTKSDRAIVLKCIFQDIPLSKVFPSLDLKAAQKHLEKILLKFEQIIFAIKHP